MIKKYVYGEPFETEALTENIETAEGKPGYGEICAEDGFSFTYIMDEEDIVYGLGESNRGINKRGFIYTSNCTDDPEHTEDKHSLYGAHNLIIVSGKETFGMFFDYPAAITFDIGYTRMDTMKVTCENADLKLYVIEGESPYDIVKQFRHVIGRSYIPPKFAFGFGQSRWGYTTKEDFRKVAAGYRENHIPIDMIYMDIDYMQSYKDFTLSEENFQDFPEFVKELKDQDIRLIPIIDAGVKVEPGYDVYEEGVKNRYFCQREDGSDFVAAVWPGDTHFPDVLNKDARKWFGDKYRFLIEKGIDGFWNDMNEPAIFYTEDRLAETLEKIKELTSGNMGINEYFEFTGMVAGLNGNKGDYDKFYHNIDGKMVKHSEVHNLYGMNMTRSAFEALQKIEPEKRTLFFSRSSYTGAHRYGGIWQGDNKSWWSHILHSMQQLPALNMAGFIFTGSDTGGFGSDTTEDLMLRWLQFALFTPLFRNHSADGTRRQELYQFDNLDKTAEMIKIRYSLIPYLYSEFLKAVLNNEMLFRPVSFDFPEDKDAQQTEDQLFLGNEIMIAPIYKQNAHGRYVYLPEEMMLVRMKEYNDYETEILPSGHHFVRAELDELVFFIRKGKSIPMCEPAVNTRDIDYDSLSLVGYSGAGYELYKDNGISPRPEESLEVISLK